MNLYLLNSGLEDILAVHLITMGLPQGRRHICLDLFMRCSTDSLSSLFGTFEDSEYYITAKCRQKLTPNLITSVFLAITEKKEAFPQQFLTNFLFLNE